jgi:hypothetical protein
MTAIFISYRRAETDAVVGRIYDRLTAQFPKDSVFRDVDNIPAGVRFPAALQDALGKTSVALIVIGPNWASATDSKGRRRLDDPADFVRIEVEAVLAMGIPVIPLLVSNAAIPPTNALPDSIKPLADCQALSIRPDPDFHPDMDRLIYVLAQTLMESTVRPGGPRGRDPAQPANSTTPVDQRSYSLVVQSLLATKLATEGLATFNAFHRKQYKGRSGQLHEIDVSFEARVGDLELLFVVACNTSGRDVTVDELMAFSYRLRDIAAHKGMLVSTGGFDSATLRLARAERIALLTAREGHLVDSWCGAFGQYFLGSIYRFEFEITGDTPELVLTGLRQIACNETWEYTRFDRTPLATTYQRGGEIVNAFFLLPAEADSPDPPRKLSRSEIDQINWGESLSTIKRGDVRFTRVI